jgi:hypothetical protein
LETTKTTRLDIALGPQAQDLGSGSRWTSGSFKEATVVTGHSATPLSSVAVAVRSSKGPVMQGLTITHGCGPKPSTSSNSKCFGMTQAENLAAGSGLLVSGILLLLCPVVSIILVCAGVFSCLSFLRRSTGPGFSDSLMDAV